MIVPWGMAWIMESFPIVVCFSFHVCNNTLYRQEIYR